MTGRFIDRYEVILLDQGRTFMFENDRFGPEEDYFRVYRELGGGRLTRERLREIMDGLVRHMVELGEDWRRNDSFPSVSEALCEIHAGLDGEDVAILGELVARCEVGSISGRDADAIRGLALTHRLGVVSNIWGAKDAFERNLAAVGVHGCFEHLVWSSEMGCIKPSPRLFRHAIGLFGVPAGKVLFVGDHPFRDVAGAASCGCSTVWVQNNGEEFPEGVEAPDLAVRHLGDLLETEDGKG